MISPQELQNKKFEKAVFGGYDMAGIDEFLDVLIPDYTALYKENMSLKNKMKVLVDKIEEYRSVDEEMRKALYSAQVTARELIQKTQAESQQVLDNARREAENILEAAHAEAEGRVAGMQQAIHEEEERLRQAREVSAAYSQTVIELLQKSITAIQMIADSAPEAGSVAPPAAPAVAVPTAPAAPAAAAEEGEKPEKQDAVDPMLETRVFERVQAAQQAAEEALQASLGQKDAPAPTEQKQEAPSLEDTARFKFENLKFGKDYQPDEDLKG